MILLLKQQPGSHTASMNAVCISASCSNGTIKARIPGPVPITEGWAEMSALRCSLLIASSPPQARAPSSPGSQENPLFQVHFLPHSVIIHGLVP